MFDIRLLFSEADQQLLDLLSSFPNIHWEMFFDGKMPTKGEHVVIDPYVVIEDEVVIGNNVHIRSGALIRSKTIISDNCVIGHGAEVKESYLAEGSKIGSHCFVGNSILGKSSRIGSGTITANRRFDQQPVPWQGPDGPIASKQKWNGLLLGEQARLGAHCTTNPGTVIGNGTWVSSGLVVPGFLPAKKFVKQDGTIVENIFEGYLE